MYPSFRLRRGSLLAWLWVGDDLERTWQQHVVTTVGILLVAIAVLLGGYSWALTLAIGIYLGLALRTEADILVVWLGPGLVQVARAQRRTGPLLAIPFRTWTTRTREETLNSSNGLTHICLSPRLLPIPR